MQAVGEDSVQAQIEALRMKLLDLTLRNRMLNYRPSKRIGLTVAGEDSAQVLRILVDEARVMSFTGKPDPSAKQLLKAQPSDFGDEVSMAELIEAAEDELNAFVENAAMPVDQMDTKLSTNEFESVLQAKLRTIMREAHLAEEELGVNTLFLTLGALEWSETDERSYKAPLLFVPVNLEQLPNGSIRLRHDGSDIGENLPLRAKLKEFNLKLPERDEEKTIYTFFDEIESTVRKRDDWVVHRDDICLAFFNYEKYAMYVDLGGDQWPAGNKPCNAPEIVKILGTGYPLADSPIGDTTQLDGVRPTSKTFEVYDADSSQTIAMIRAAEGLSIVVEGPPGTGKSQTITNIIAEAVASQKSVLFVAAKRAALDVVKRRLSEADLGDLCLDLHDKLTNRKAFYAEIKRTVGRRLSFAGQDERVLRLHDLRTVLNAHSNDINQPIDGFGISPFVAMTQLSSLPAESPEDREARIDFEKLRTFTHGEFQQLIPFVRAVQIRLHATGIPSQHVFWGVTIDYLDPGKRLDLQQDLQGAIQSLQKALERLDKVSKQLCVQLPNSFDAVPVLRKCAERALAAPPHDGVAIKLETWTNEETAVRSAVDTLRIWHKLRNGWKSKTVEQIWDQDFGAHEPAIVRYSHQWFRSVLPSYRKSRRFVRAFITDQALTSDSDLPQLLQDVESVKDAGRKLHESAPTMARLFGVQWQGTATDPEVLLCLLEWVLSIRRDIELGSLPPGILDFLEGTDARGSMLSAVEDLEQEAATAKAMASGAAQLLGYDLQSGEEKTIDGTLSKIESWRASIGKLHEMISLNEARNRLAHQNGGFLLPLVDTWPLASERLETCLRRSYYTGVIRHALELRPGLKSFERAVHEQHIQEFQRLDDFKQQYNRALVRRLHQQRLPTFDVATGNLQLLKVQCELQRRHKSIRWAMTRAGEAIQRIKPVFMMSPLSVAIHLPPELPRFDIVIFDEASQIKPEDALCSILRAKQTIVVGDTRQMPPTSFFDRVAEDDDLDDDSDEISELGREAKKLESILNLMSAVTQGSIRRPDLRWHYRSIHPALIQPSNEMFYENRLIIFPSASVEQDGKRIGLVFHHLPEAVYEPGAKKRMNRIEAERVADAVLQHVKEDRDLSLMVAAMNKQQADLIHDEVQRRERQDPEAFRKFREIHAHEPLEVKNLENVQGDERDVVFISITYGRDEHGNFRQHFGPILKEGGERRLNVLISRARRRCEVFSSITSDDVRAESGRAGLYSLKQYLSFAETGQMNVTLLTGQSEDSPFEEEVVRALRGRGYQVDTQVGSEGYRIDIGVLDPVHPGRYLLGIECDGATYHSAQSARDRDKLRQRVLEARGWTMYRIWSHDWWQDKDSEINRLIAAIDGLSAGQIPSLNDGVVIEEFRADAEVSSQEQGSHSLLRTYVQVAPFRGFPTDDNLAAYVVAVVSVEGPIHHDLLVNRLRDAMGVGRTGRHVRAQVDTLISNAVAGNLIRSYTDGYFIDQGQFTAPRDWTARPAAEKQTSLVSEAEIAAGLRMVVRPSFGISRQSAIREAFRLMGFKATERAMVRGEAVVERMLQAGGLKQRGDELYL